MPLKINRKWRVVLIVLVLLVAFRLALPYIVTRYVNKVLSELEGYEGHVDDIDIHLIRGAYRIHGLKIFEKEGTRELPFVDLPATDLAIEWPALLNGSVVGEVKFEKPVLNFIAAKKGSGEQAGENVDWTEPIKKLMPLQINRLRVTDGKITFNDFSTKPKVDLFLQQVQIDAQNLNNAKDNPEELPSRVYMQATSIGGGQLNATMRINILKQLPDFDLDLKFEKVNMTALNDFFEAYAKIDVERGDFNMYSEVVVLNGRVTGYVKPLFNGLKVVNWKEDKKQPVKLVWESMVGLLAEVFENQKKDQFATRVPLEGSIASVDTPFWPTVWSIFSNAFVKAFDSSTDGTINIASAPGLNSSEKAKGSTSTKSKKEVRRERRQARREQRKREKMERKERGNEKADKRNGKDNS